MAISQQTILLIVQILSLIFLIVYVVKTWEMASATRKAAEATEKSVIEMREARDQETAPYVITYFDIPLESNFVYLVVKNIGRTVATQVKLTFTPPLHASKNRRELSEVGFIKDGIEAMPPNYEIRTFVDSSVSFFGDKDLPLKYEATITYFGGLESKQRITKLPLDLSANKGISYIRHKDVDDLVGAIEKIASETREIRNATDDISENLERGVFLSNSNLLVTVLEPYAKSWKKHLIAKLNEFENLWAVSSRKERETGIGLSRLKARILIISEQILVLNTYKVDGISNTEIEKLSLISSKLRELGQKIFYMDGGISLKEFNELGDSIIGEIHELKKRKNAYRLTLPSSDEGKIE